MVGHFRFGEDLEPGDRARVGHQKVARVDLHPSRSTVLSASKDSLPPTPLGDTRMAKYGARKWRMPNDRDGAVGQGVGGTCRS
jgi:hypothetical protein